ncbi:MAG: molybdenum cofactor guanylyltransferase [Saprospiraceae bacterium]|nr:molybdenum cofactor guanylyltransferase [Saprospiraceae bacterium]
MGKEISKENNLSGLLLAGGFSIRMGSDKALITHEGIPMFERAEKLLSQLCSPVYISIRDEQVSKIGNARVITDTGSSHGPLSGLFAAFNRYPKQAFLVIPVDMPHLTTRFLHQYLIARRNPEMDATVIRDQSGSIQPLVAIYEPTSARIIAEQFTAHQYSVKGLLRKLRVNEVDYLGDQHLLANYNRPEDWISKRIELE